MKDLRYWLLITWARWGQLLWWPVCRADCIPGQPRRKFSNARRKRDWGCGCRYNGV